uniref:Uncharacterized protein n=1 Tax=viral metagenome TaxID=1070528 RepID=A0A6C0AQ83_9ZZZZ
MSLTSENDEELKQLGFSSEDIDRLKEKNYEMQLIRITWNYFLNNYLSENENRNLNEEDRIVFMEANKNKIAGEVMNKFNKDENTQQEEEQEEEPSWLGGKKSKRKSKRKTRKTNKKSKRKTKRKLSKIRTNKKKNFKGGMCFGNGVGANTNDPNFSIYNTNLTKLFPYKPTN